MAKTITAHMGPMPMEMLTGCEFYFLVIFILRLFMLSAHMK